jgi:Protein of unknown function (DUF4232)
VVGAWGGLVLLAGCSAGGHSLVSTATTRRPVVATAPATDRTSTASADDLSANGTIEPREGDLPAAGVCGGDAARIQTVALRSLDYVPQPRCLIIRDQQFLRIVNGMSTSITARLGKRLRVTLAPGRSVTFPEPIGKYFASGVHSLTLISLSGIDTGASIWVDPICAPSGRPCSSPPDGIATSTPSPSTTTTVAPTSGGCNPKQMRLALDRNVGSTMQQPAAFFSVTNTSGKSCTLDGYPVLMLFDSSGHQVPGAIGNGNSYQLNDPGPHVTAVEPGGSVFFGFGWTDSNPPDGNHTGCVHATRARVRLPTSAAWMATTAQLDPILCDGGSVTAIATRASFIIAVP